MYTVYLPRRNCTICICTIVYESSVIVVTFLSINRSDYQLSVSMWMQASLNWEWNTKIFCEDLLGDFSTWAARYWHPSTLTSQTGEREKKKGSGNRYDIIPDVFNLHLLHRAPRVRLVSLFYFTLRSPSSSLLTFIRISLRFYLFLYASRPSPSGNQPF